MTVSRDIALESNTLFERAKASSELQALVGNAITSFLDADMFDLYGKPDAPNRPKLPWLVWLTKGLSGPSGVMRPLNISIWLYCDPIMGKKRLLDMASVVNDLFGSPSQKAIAGYDLSVVYIGTPLPDQSLGDVLGLETRIQSTRRN